MLLSRPVQPRSDVLLRYHQLLLHAGVEVFTTRSRYAGEVAVRVPAGVVAAAADGNFRLPGNGWYSVPRQPNCIVETPAGTSWVIAVRPAVSHWGPRLRLPLPRVGYCVPPSYRLVAPGPYHHRREIRRPPLEACRPHEVPNLHRRLGARLQLCRRLCEVDGSYSDRASCHLFPPALVPLGSKPLLVEGYSLLLTLSLLTCLAAAVS